MNGWMDAAIPLAVTCAVLAGLLIYQSMRLMMLETLPTEQTALRAENAALQCLLETARQAAQAAREEAQEQCIRADCATVDLDEAIAQRDEANVLLKDMQERYTALQAANERLTASLVAGEVKQSRTRQKPLSRAVTQTGQEQGG